MHLQESLDPVWVYPKKDPKWKKTIMDEFQIHPITAQILVSRNFHSLEEIHHFLYDKLPHLHDPNLLSEMPMAIERVVSALKNQENILIYGDNDVDGMTATALLVDFFKTLNASVHFYVPNRVSTYRTILTDAIEFAVKKSCTLMITVDCGITAAKEIQEVLKYNIDVIITDHHEPTEKVPNCIATLNPKLVNSTYPNREITGVGVAFKLAHALVNYFSEKGSPLEKINLKEYLDLVALGTISDMGGLRGENRILVRYGLKELKKTKRLGLKKLFEVCEIDPQRINPIDIASKVAPRLNSIGRISNASKGVELFLIKDEKQAEVLAKELDLNNLQRQKIERKAFEDIEKLLNKSPELLQDRAIVLHSNKWHPGIVAILAARVSKQYNRPAVIIALDQSIGKGSIRTIPEFPLLSLLKEREDLFLNFGGHDFAAGFTIQEKNIQAFQEDFIGYANKKLKKKDVQNKVIIDAFVRFDELTFDLMDSLSLLEPFGNENPNPILYCEANQAWPPRIVRKNHLKVFLEQDDRSLEGIGFSMAHRKNQLREKHMRLQVCFSPYVNAYMKKSSIQLHIRDFKVL